jgi:hypothetical protein
MLSSAAAAALFAIALCFPAIQTEAPRRGETLGYEALLLSALLLLLVPGAIVGILKSVFYVLGGDMEGITGGLQALSIVLAVLANPMFVAGCAALAMRRLRIAQATSSVAVAGMISSWWVVTTVNVSILGPPDAVEIRRPVDGYYLWCAAGIMVLMGSCAQWVVSARRGEGEATGRR